MRLFRIGLYLISIIILQSVVFARINLWGVIPDLILVSVIILAVLQKARYAIPIAFGFGFIQDMLSFGVFLNTLTKVAVSAAISILKENFIGSPYTLCLYLVVIFTPLSLVFEGAFSVFFFEKRIVLSQFFLTMLLTTVYNLIVFPFLFPILERLDHD